MERTPNGTVDPFRDPLSGRFANGNSAARKHGLRSQAKTELQRRSRRARGASARLVNALTDAGRPLDAPSLPLAHKWGQLEVLRADHFAALERDPGNTRLLETYLAVCRLQIAVERELKMTPSTLVDIAEGRPRPLKAVAAAEAHAELLQLYGRGER